MSACEFTRERIHPYLDHELPAAEVLEFESHLMDCSACRASFESVRAVVDVVRGAKPLYEIPESSLASARSLVAGHARRRVWLQSAALLLIGLGLGFSLWLGARPASDQFSAFAAEAHLRYAKGQFPLDVLSSQPEAVSRWLQSRLPFAVHLPDYPVGAGQQKKYELVGARLLQYENEDVLYLAYRLDGKPISLLMTASQQVAPGGGDIYRSGRLDFHFSDSKGLGLISWTDRGIHYSLVSDLGAGRAESCVICHPKSSDRRVIEELVPRGKG
ncbi:anti-sigma factor family protein [Paludibaculum fermentans]|uniref:anti-sigma factor family protein n=1 Tax=Paludibaculum fermentans TaxID=1473598 RepID=UPI003EBDABD7